MRILPCGHAHGPDVVVFGCTGRKQFGFYPQNLNLEIAMVFRMAFLLCVTTGPG